MTLYRKYRPQTFREVIGQNHIKITLQNEIEHGEIGHAYLFCGPRGLGKTTMARLFAKAINCENRADGESEPCNKDSCSSCSSIINGNNIDIIEIDAASHTGVENVRENIIENSRFTPNKGKYKVFIIDEVHMLSTSAFNALLKTLEEPPEHAVFILCTTEVHKIPQTIISRCQRFDLKKISADELLKRLKYIVRSEGKQVDTQVLKNIVVHSEGCARDAESLLGKILTLGDKITEEQAELVLPRSDFKSIISFLEFLSEKNTTGAIELINRLVEDGVDLQIFTGDLLEFLRKVLLIKVGHNLSDFGIELDEESQTSSERLAEKFSHDELLEMLELFVGKLPELKSAVIVQLPLELAVVELTKNTTLPADRQKIQKHKSKTDNDDQSDGGIISGSIDKIKEVKERIHPVKSVRKFTNKRTKQVISGVKRRVSHLHFKKNIKTENIPLLRERKISLKTIEEKWHEVVDYILQKNYTLSSLLKISKPFKIKKNILEVGVRSNFYKDRLEEQKNKKMVEEAISELLQVKMLVRGVIKDDLEPLEINNGSSQPASLELKPLSTIKKPKDVVEDVVNMF